MYESAADCARLRSSELKEHNGIMMFAKSYFGLNRSKAVSAAVIGIGAVGSVCLTHPAAYAAALATVNSAVTCATTAACVSGTNTKSGPGVSGTSSSGYGVLGTSTSNDGVKAVSSTWNGVSGLSTSAYGVKGVSSTNDGVYGSTTSGDAAIFGYATSSNYESVGVEGISSAGAGLFGSTNSANSAGVIGYAPAGIGISASTDSSSAYNAALYADASAGSAGTITQSYSGVGLSAASTTGYGLQAFSSNGPEALTAFNSGGDGADIRGTYIGIIGRAPASGGFPIALTDSAGNVVFQVDGAGDVAYKGQLQTLARTRSGATVQSYSATTTQPTVEDYGTGQLIAGSASVTLDPTFASTIDMTTAYRVFITPDGDTRGLFVATKTARGFVVRESQGGRSTVTFDYRIVATTQGQFGKRMSVASKASIANAPIAADHQTPVVPHVIRPALHAH
jgi:hypothetical protein